MLLMVVSGIDGCGKTTIIQELQRRLQKEGISTLYVWLRYNHILVKPIHALCRLVGLSRRYRTDAGYVWRHEFYRSRLFCSAYIYLTWLDTWLARLKLAFKLLWRKADIVICDRWVHDILIDLVVDTRRRSLLKGRWYRRFTHILPKDTKQYLIVRNATSVATARPDSYQDRNFSFRQKLYKRLERADIVTAIDNNGEVGDTVDAILADCKEFEFKPLKSAGISN